MVGLRDVSLLVVAAVEVNILSVVFVPTRGVVVVIHHHHLCCGRLSLLSSSLLEQIRLLARLATATNRQQLLVVFGRQNPTLLGHDLSRLDQVHCRKIVVLHEVVMC